MENQILETKPQNEKKDNSKLIKLIAVKTLGPK